MDEVSAEVSLDRLGPRDIAAALAARPVVYLPLGTIEWHGEHLPVGLDALTAQGICAGAARRDGGLVCPALHYGTGGGHGLYPWTVMMEDGDAIAALLLRTMRRMRDFGVRLLVLFSGHFPPEQFALIERLAGEWNAEGGTLRVLALAVDGAPGLPLAPDHAGIFETTLLHALHPDLVRIDRLPPPGAPAEPEEDPFGAARHDPAHPLHGVFGPDPRRFDPAGSAALLDGMVDWLVSRVRAAGG